MITRFDSFIEVLNLASSEGYISTDESGKFLLTQEKKEKTINTAKIVEIASKFLESPRLSDDQRATLGNVLHRYSYRYASSKMRFIKTIISIILKKGPIYNLLKISDDLFIELTEISSKKRKYGYHHSKLLNFRMFHHKILDSKTKRPELDGMTFEDSIQSFIEDLECLKNDRPSKKIELLLEELEFCLEIHKSPNINKILEKINSGSVDSLTIHGGVLAHAVLYHIEKQENGLFSFSITNTGIEAKVLPGQKTCELTYNDLTNDELNVEFFLELFKLNYSPMTLMPDVYRSIDERLLNKNKSNKKDGFRHRLQKQGTCAMQPLFALSKKRLSKLEYCRFKVLVTEREIEKLKNCRLKNNYLLGKGDAERIQMLKEGNQVLAKRKRQFRRALVTR